jgi:hypothetical protein
LLVVWVEKIVRSDPSAIGKRRRASVRGVQT